jgi:hypothetical protein
MLKAIEQWMMKYLRRKGWIVFWLDEPAKKCGNDLCWLKLYLSQGK